MKSTAYFQRMRTRPDRIAIQDDWIQKAIDDPESEEVQIDGRWRRWVYIDSEGNYLLEDPTQSSFPRKRESGGWVPASAGMTRKNAGMTRKFAYGTLLYMIPIRKEVS